jgi:WD40 repeat protein
VAFSPDGTMLATVTVDEGLVRLWEVETGTLLAGLVGHWLSPNGIEFSPDGRTLASAAADGYVGLWAVHPEDAISRLCQAVTHPLCTAD